jgi:cytochrome c biogenesis protein CcmG, thiol:disulfide interchange protein DsbE
MSEPRRRIAPFIVLGITLVMVALFVLLAGSKDRQSAETADTPLLGKPAPAIDSPTVDGATFNLARQRGNVVVLNFFTSSCVPCKQEHPQLIKFSESHAASSDGVSLISVAVDDAEATVKAFFAAQGGSWPVLEDKGIPADYGVAQVPETFVIDVNGIVKYHTISAMTATCLDSMAAAARDPDEQQPHSLPGCGQ